MKSPYSKIKPTMPSKALARTATALAALEETADQIESAARQMAVTARRGQARIKAGRTNSVSPAQVKQAVQICRALSATMRNGFTEKLEALDVALDLLEETVVRGS